MDRVKLEGALARGSAGKDVRALRAAGRDPRRDLLGRRPRRPRSPWTPARCAHAVSGPGGLHAAARRHRRRQQGAPGNDQGHAARPGARPRRSTSTSTRFRLDQKDQTVVGGAPGGHRRTASNMGGVLSASPPTRSQISVLPAAIPETITVDVSRARDRHSRSGWPMCPPPRASSFSTTPMGTILATSPRRSPRPSSRASRSRAKRARRAKRASRARASRARAKADGEAGDEPPRKRSAESRLGSSLDHLVVGLGNPGPRVRS